MGTPCRRSLHLYLAGRYEELYAGAASRLPARLHRRPIAAPQVYLCEGRHLFWALITPTDRNLGKVEFSNVLPLGAIVKSKKAWPFAIMRRIPGSPQTLVSPRYLKVIWRPLPPRKGGKARRFVPTHELALVA